MALIFSSGELPQILVLGVKDKGTKDLCSREAFRTLRKSSLSS